MTKVDEPTVRFAGIGVRIASASLLIPIILLDVYVGGIWFELLMLIMGIAIAYEWTAMTHSGNKFQFLLHCCAAGIAIFGPIWAGILPAIAMVCLVWLISLFTDKDRSLFSRFGVLYVALPVGAFTLLRLDDNWGLTVVLWLFTMVWCADTLAYVFGRLIGGPKLMPSISPKKTWAGLLGAIVGALLATFVVHSITTPAPFMTLALMAVVFAVVEQAGDFFESAAKRAAGVKDSGRLIPGHGGVLDRVDGLLAVVLLAGLIGVLRAGSDAAATGLIQW